MALLSKGNIFAIAKEATFNTAPTFADGDVVEVTGDTSLSPNVDTVQRNVIKNSFLGQPSIATKETGSGTVGVELIPEDSGTDLNGDAVLEAALGIKSGPAADNGAFIGYSDAGTTTANEVYRAKSGETGTATLYTLSKPADTVVSLAIKQFVGGSADDVITYTGVVPNSTTFNFPVADIATVSFDVGASGFATTTGETLLTGVPVTGAPFVGKSVTFTVDGVSYCAKDLSFTVSNTITDIECLTGSGIGNKVPTAKEVTGSITLTFEDFAELDKLKNNTDAKIYLEMTSGAKKFAIYLPKVRYTSLSLADADGLIDQQIEFAAFDNADGDAILVASL